MTKLLKEPRVIKEIMAPKKRVRRVKKKDNKVEFKYRLLKETNNPKVEELFNIYRKDKYKARVKFFNSNKDSYSFNRLVLFEKGKDFSIVYFKVSFGISVTNKIYSSQKQECSISFKGGKFWHKTGVDKIRPLTIYGLTNFISTVDNYHIYFNFSEIKKQSSVLTYLHDRFPWVQMVFESELSHNTTFTLIYSKKLFGMLDLHRYLMKSSSNINKEVLKSNYFKRGRRISNWLNDKKYLENLDFITSEFINSDYFFDSIKMAKTLDKKINCKWGLKRLKEEHDKWSREVTNIVLDCEGEYDLNIKPIFKAFADFSGYKLLKTNKDMLREGMLQNHCVGTYIDKVEQGKCAIYHVDGYTLQVKIGELNWDNEGEGIIRGLESHIRPNYYRPEYYDIFDESRKFILINSQFRGRHNENAPKELVGKVEQMMIDFVNADGFERLNKKEYKPKVKPMKDEFNMVLPF